MISKYYAKQLDLARGLSQEYFEFLRELIRFPIDALQQLQAGFVILALMQARNNSELLRALIECNRSQRLQEPLDEQLVVPVALLYRVLGGLSHAIDHQFNNLSTRTGRIIDIQQDFAALGSKT